MNDATKIYELYMENAVAQNEQPQMKVNKYGTKLWYLRDELHRINGPAVEWTDGNKQWRLHGKLHREDGPANEYANGKEWWLHGKHYDDVKQWAQAVLKLRNKPHDEQAAEDYLRMILTKDDLI
jgi:hypothetical protein